MTLKTDLELLDFLLGEEGEGITIFGRVVEPAARWAAITAGAPALLIVGGKRGGKRPVHYKAHVRLVDAHTERNCRYDDAALARHPLLLYCSASLSSKIFLSYLATSLSAHAYLGR